jgi:hypothetical protein
MPPLKNLKTVIDRMKSVRFSLPLVLSGSWIAYRWLVVSQVSDVLKVTATSTGEVCFQVDTDMVRADLPLHLQRKSGSRFDLPARLLVRSLADACSLARVRR